MNRAFIENGQWQGVVDASCDVLAHGRATLRGSALAGLITLALIAAPEFRLPEQVTATSRALTVSAPELVSFKRTDRVPSLEETTNSFVRRKPRDEEKPTVSELKKPVSGIEIVDGLTSRAGEMTVRIAGVALPEANRTCRRLDGLAVPCADRATSYLELLVKGRAVACDRAGTAEDGIDKGHCRIGTTDIAEQMIRQGWARADAKDNQRLVMAEVAARKQKLGIWRE